MAKLHYFNFEKEVLKKRPNSNIYIILGGRGNGKSYSVKNYCFADAYKHGYGHYVNLLRRMDRNISPSQNEEFYADVDTGMCTDNTHEYIRQYRQYIYFENMDDRGKYIKSDSLKVGRVTALSTGQSYKSNFDRQAYKWTIFEEFITDEMYLMHEPSRLLELLQTIYANDRADGKAVLIGNTISTICPYYSDWDLGRISDMECGEIRDFQIDNTMVSVYMCHPLTDDSGKNVVSNFLFGRHAKKQDGIWTVHSHPHYDYIGGETCIYTAVFKRYENMYLMRLLLHPVTSAPFWYIERKTSPIKEGERVIGEWAADSPPNHTTDFLPLTQKEKRAFDLLFVKNAVTFDTNLTGDEFYRHIANMKRG